MTRARSAPSASAVDLPRISDEPPHLLAIGASFDTARSESAGLKVENCAPPKSFSTAPRVVPASAA